MRGRTVEVDLLLVVLLEVDGLRASRKLLLELIPADRGLIYPVQRDIDCQLASDCWAGVIGGRLRLYLEIIRHPAQ